MIFWITAYLVIGVLVTELCIWLGNVLPRGYYLTILLLWPLFLVMAARCWIKDRGDRHG